MWKEVSWPDIRYYSIIVLHNKYWVPFYVGPFAMLMSPTQMLSPIRYCTDWNWQDSFHIQ